MKRLSLLFFLLPVLLISCSESSDSNKDRERAFIGQWTYTHAAISSLNPETMENTTMIESLIELGIAFTDIPDDLTFSAGNEVTVVYTLGSSAEGKYSVTGNQISINAPSFKERCNYYMVGDSFYLFLDKTAEIKTLRPGTDITKLIIGYRYERTGENYF